MSSNASNRNAAQRERERRAAAKAKRQAAKANPAARVAADVPVREAKAAADPLKSTPMAGSGNARKETKGATLVADPDAAVMPMGDRNGMVATWMMLALLVLLGLLAIAVTAAS